MTARVLTGSKQEIVDRLASLPGDVREVIVFFEEGTATPQFPPETSADIFAEMAPYTVRAGNVDYGREANLAEFRRFQTHAVNAC